MGPLNGRLMRPGERFLGVIGGVTAAGFGSESTFRVVDGRDRMGSVIAMVGRAVSQTHVYNAEDLLRGGATVAEKGPVSSISASVTAATRGKEIDTVGATMMVPPSSPL